jgi:4,5-dihydroxyphthalate decarboxylase
MFRHSAFFIRADRGIRAPRDLVGRRVGVREFSMTAALVARGMLEDEYGVTASALRWCYGPADDHDTKPVIRMVPRGIEVAPIEDGRNLSDLLRDGEIDAMVAYKPPRCFSEGAPNVTTLFPDHEKVEQDYFARTGIFPIMHLIGIRRELATDATLCGAVCEAFNRAKQQALESLSTYQALSVALPWAPAESRRTRALMGPDYWPYGLARNREAIDAVARYSFCQGLASRILSADELFASSTKGWIPQQS